MKVVLINTKFPKPYANKIKEGAYFHNHIWQPLDLAYVAAYLERDGHEVSIIDANTLRHSDSQLKEELKRISPGAVIINSSPLDRWQCPYIDIGPVYRTFRTAKASAGAVTICIGPHGTVWPKNLLKECRDIDFVVLGEPELTCCELIASSFSKRTAGVAFRKGKGAVVNGHREPVQDLDSMPMPAYHLLPMGKYEDPLSSKPFSLILTSRGCPFNCIFCYKDMYGKRYRSRSPESVMREIRLLHDRYGTREIFIYDLEFTVIPDRVEKICDRIIKEGLGISWRCAARIDTVNEGLLRKMHQAGCHTIYFGIESGSQKILDRARKGIKVGEAVRIARLCKKIGITPMAYFLIGLPGESRETLRETIDFVKSADIADNFGYNVSIPYPGTRLFEIGKEKGVIKRDSWDECIRVAGLVDNELTPKDVEGSSLDTWMRKSIYSKKYGRMYFMNPRFIMAGIRVVKSKPSSIPRAFRKWLSFIRGGAGG